MDAPSSKAPQGEDPRVEDAVWKIVSRMEDYAAMPLNGAAEARCLRPLFAPLVSEIETLRQENAKLRESNTALNRRVTKAEAIVAQRVEEQERKGKSLGRSLANAGYYALKAENAKLREALEAFAGPCADFRPPGSCIQNDGTGLWCVPCRARAALDPSSTGTK